jgi:hypothetical protein
VFTKSSARWWPTKTKGNGSGVLMPGEYKRQKSD